MKSNLFRILLLYLYILVFSVIATIDFLLYTATNSVSKGFQYSVLIRLKMCDQYREPKAFQVPIYIYTNTDLVMAVYLDQLSGKFNKIETIN